MPPNGLRLERLDPPIQNISILKQVKASNTCRKGRKKMVTLTTEMKEVFAKNKPYAIATASENGTPDATSIGTVGYGGCFR